MERDVRTPNLNLIVHNDVGLLGPRVLLFQHARDISERYVVRQRLHFPKRSLALRKVKVGAFQKAMFLRHELLRSVFGVTYHLNRTGQYRTAHRTTASRLP